MPSVTDFPAKGRISQTRAGKAVFKPAGSTYELELTATGETNLPLNTPVEGLIRLNARKVYSVPSGGNFITPIMGPPKIVQGRVKFLDEKQIVVHASATFVVTLPDGASTIDLNNGAIGVGSMVNVVAFPGATFELKIA